MGRYNAIEASPLQGFVGRGGVVVNPGLTPWAIRRLSALSALLYAAYMFVLFVLYTIHKHQYIIFTNIIIVAEHRMKGLHKL